jgi:hypothetical protein
MVATSANQNHSLGRVDSADSGANGLAVALYGTTPEQQHIRSPAEPCRLTIVDDSPCHGLLVEKAGEAFQISLRSKRAYLKSTGLNNHPVAFIVESWPSSSKAFVFFCPSVEIAQAWIESLRLTGCVMTDWRKKGMSLKTRSKKKHVSETEPEIIRAIIKPTETGTLANEVVVKVAQADKLDELLNDAYLFASVCRTSGKTVGGANGLYEVVMSGRRTLALILDTNTARDMEYTRLQSRTDMTTRSAK